MHQHPMHSRIFVRKVLTDREAVLKIDISPMQWQKGVIRWVFSVVAATIFLICLSIIVGLIRHSIVQITHDALGDGIGLLLAAVLFAALVFISTEAWLVEATETVHLEIDRQQFRLRCYCCILRGKPYHEIHRPTATIHQVDLHPKRLDCNVQYFRSPYGVFRYFPNSFARLTSCAVWDGDRPYEFGFYLAQSEKEWLVQEISDFLGCIRSENLHLDR